MSEELDNLKEDLSEKGFDSVGHKLLIQAIAGILNGDTTSKGILNSKSEDIRDNWPFIVESIKKAIDWLFTTMKCAHLDFLPFRQQLVPLSKYFSINGTPTSSHNAELKKWFWATSFSDRYSSGRTTEKMNVDLKLMKTLRTGELLDSNLYKTNIGLGDLLNTKFSKANPLTRAFLLLMATKSPKDLISNTDIDLGKALSKYNRKEYHHIFPRAFLKKNGYNSGYINTIINFCFLSSQSNKKISRKSPSNYIFNQIDDSQLDEILKSNLIPTTKEIYLQDNYTEFLSVRGQLIVRFISDQLK